MTSIVCEPSYHDIHHSHPRYYQKLQQIYGNEGQDVLTNLQAAAFGGAGSAAAEQDIMKKRRQEAAQFGGSSGVGQGSLGGNVQAGSI